MTAAVRPAAVAGRFYPSDPGDLRATVDDLFAAAGADTPAPVPAVAAVVPHAGLAYSGLCAAHVLVRITIPSTVVIIAPNHTGRVGAGTGASVFARGAFATPLGDVPVDDALAGQLLAGPVLFAHDPDAHAFEHAIEVELPLLQVLAPAAAIVPVVLAFDDAARCRAVGEALAAAVRGRDDVLLLASSDMTHFEPAHRAARKDEHALDRVRALDADGLLAACREEDITMCGRAPVAAVLNAASALGASAAELVDYRHSGMVTGDNSSVVAYAGLVIR